MFITGRQASELLFILLMILIAAAMASYAIGIHVGRRHPAEDQAPVPDLTVHLKHVPPTTAELFAQIEREAVYDTTPLSRIVQPGARRYGQERTTDFIAAIEADTSEYIASWRRDSHPYPEMTP